LFFGFAPKPFSLANQGLAGFSLKKIPGLQCVDLIAWLTLQLGLNNFHNKPMEGLAGECIKDFENY